MADSDPTPLLTPLPTGCSDKGPNKPVTFPAGIKIQAGPFSFLFTPRCKKIILGTGSVMAGGFCWQVVAIALKSNIKPSVPLEWLADSAGNFFNLIGELFARLSSYLHYINFGIVKDAVVELCGPTLRLIGSPLETLSGYASYALECCGAQDHWLVYLGSALLIVLLYICRRYFMGGRIERGIRSLKFW